MKSGSNNTKALIIRISRNCHRYLVVCGGKFRVLVTQEKDFLFNLSALFGLLNQAVAGSRLHTICYLTALFLSVCFSCPVAFALPSGWEVVSGDVQFETSGNTLNVTSNSMQAIVNYQSFNLSAGEAVNFFLPDATSSILNRVLGGPSTIMGAINSNGTVLLSNPAGINFGASAQVNVGSMIASTLNIADADYLAENLLFTRNGATAGITNEGGINASNGYVVLAGSAIKNNGQITAPLGKVALAVGDEVQVQVSPSMDLKVTVTQELKEAVEGYQSAIASKGKIEAAGIEVQAKVGKQLFASVVNLDGVIKATSVSKDSGGQIVIHAESSGQDALVENHGTIEASNSGSIKVSGDIVKQAGKLLAEGSDNAQGGFIDVTSTQKTTLADGSYTSARGRGENSDAGEIRIWSDGDTHFEQGAVIDISGGETSGNGGFTEVSAVDTVLFNGQAHGGATDGQAGSILIDPTNIRIVATGAAGVDDVNHGDPDNGAGESTFTNSTFNGFANVDLEATNDITVETPWNLSSITTGNNLTLRAGNNININNTVTTSGGNVNLYADHDFSGTGGAASNGIGSVNIAGTGSIVTNNGNVLVQGAGITQNGVITSGTGDVSLNTVNNGNVSLGANITASDVDITANGSGNITRTNGTIISNTLDLVSGTGSIGTAANRITTRAANWTANTGGIGNVYLNRAYAAGSSYSFTVGDSSSGGIFDITHAGTLTITGDITAGSFNANSSYTFQTTGNITTNGAISITANADANPNTTEYVRISGTLDSNGSNISLRGTLIDINNTVNAGAGTITLANTGNAAIAVGGAVDNADTATVLDISSAELGRLFGSNVVIGQTAKTGGLTVTGDTTLNTGGLKNYNLTLNNGGAVTLNNAITTNNKNLTINAKGVTVNGAISAGTADVAINTISNGSIALGADITADDVDITAHGSGSITRSAGAIASNTLDLTSSTGNIGASNNRIHTSANTLSANTGGSGSVYLDRSVASPYPGFTLNTSSAGGAFDITHSGNATQQGNITAGSFSSSSSFAYTNNGNITTTGGNISITANTDAAALNEPVIINGLLTSNGGNITLQSTQLDINNTVNAGAGTITLANTGNAAIAVGGAVDNADTATVLDISSAELGRLSASQVTIGETVRTGDLSVGGDINLDTLGYILNLRNGGDITAANASLLKGAHSLNLSAGGSIDLSGASQNITTATATNGNIDISSTAGDIYTQAITASNGAVTLDATGGLRVNGAIDTQAISLMADSDLNNAGNLTIDGTLDSNGNTIILQGAQVDINQSVNAGGGGITIQPTTSKTIHVGGAVDDADSAAILDVSAPELNRLTAGQVTIGTTALASNLILQDNLDLTTGTAGTDPGTYALRLLTGGNLNGNGTTLTFDNPVTLTASGNLTTPSFVGQDVDLYLNHGQALSRAGTMSLGDGKLFINGVEQCISHCPTAASTVDPGTAIAGQVLRFETTMGNSLKLDDSVSIILPGNNAPVNNTVSRPASGEFNNPTANLDGITPANSVLTESQSNKIRLDVYNPVKGDKVLQLNTDKNSVTILDVTTHQPITSLGVGKKPVYLVTNKDNSLAFVGNADDNSVTILDVQNQTVVETFDVGISPVRLVLSDDEQSIRIYGASQQLVVIDISAKQITVHPSNSQPVEPTFNQQVRLEQTRQLKKSINHLVEKYFART